MPCFDGTPMPLSFHGISHFASQEWTHQHACMTASIREVEVLDHTVEHKSELCESPDLFYPMPWPWTDLLLCLLAKEARKRKDAFFWAVGCAADAILENALAEFPAHVGASPLWLRPHLPS